jgi:cell division protein FtsZ
MLEGGQALGEAEAVLVSLTGGPDLPMLEVNRLMEQLQSRCPQARVIMGAAIVDAFRDRLAVTLIVARRCPESLEAGASASGAGEEVAVQLLATRSGSRLLPPAPSLRPDGAEQPLAGPEVGAPRPRRGPLRLRQGQLPLEIVGRGRFDNSERTIHNGEDLDVPTYLRHGVALN